MKTRREASSWAAQPSAPLARPRRQADPAHTHGGLFFERDLVAVVEAPHRAHGDAELLLSTKSFADFLQRQIGLLGNEVEQPILVRLERRPTVASAGFIFDAACRRPQVEPTHCCRSGDVEQARDLAPALTLLDQCNRARTQVIRVPPRHGISPPLLTEQPESDLRARWNPLWRFRLVSSRKRSSDGVTPERHVAEWQDQSTKFEFVAVGATREFD